MPNGIYQRTEKHKLIVTQNPPKQIKYGKNFKCNRCEKENIYRKPNEIKKGTKFYCSRNCSNKTHAFLISKLKKGIKISEAVKEKLRKYKGEKSSNWKGGKPKCKLCNTIIGYKSTYCMAHKHLLWTKEKWEKAWNGSR